MLTKQKVLNLALALTKAGDSDLLSGDALLSDQGLTAEDKDRVREVGRIVHFLCQDYSYVCSTEFTLGVVSKSSSVVEMKMKMESAPPRRKERLESLYFAIRTAINGTVALRGLVREDQQPFVDKLQSLLADLTIPHS